MTACSKCEWCTQVEIRNVEQADSDCRQNRVRARTLYGLSTASNGGCSKPSRRLQGVSLGRPGSKGKGEADRVDRLGSGKVSGSHEMVSWTALGNGNARGVGPSRVMSTMGW